MSDKTVAQKLLIKDNYKVRLINPPPDYASILGELPENATILSTPSEPADLVQVFVRSRQELTEQLSHLKTRIKPEGLIWITYPKGTSKIKTDINRDSIREYAQSLGWRAVAMVSVDDTWAALRLRTN